MSNAGPPPTLAASVTPTDLVDIPGLKRDRAPVTPERPGEAGARRGTQAKAYQLNDT